jgi:hypothetical protein
MPYRVGCFAVVSTCSTLQRTPRTVLQYLVRYRHVVGSEIPVQVPVQLDQRVRHKTYRHHVPSEEALPRFTTQITKSTVVSCPMGCAKTQNDDQRR